jgi:hypothetical protein
MPFHFSFLFWPLDQISIVEFQEFECQGADGAGGDGGCNEKGGGGEARGAHSLGLLPVSTSNEVRDFDISRDECFGVRAKHVWKTRTL